MNGIPLTICLSASWASDDAACRASSPMAEVCHSDSLVQSAITFPRWQTDLHRDPLHRPREAQGTHFPGRHSLHQMASPVVVPLLCPKGPWVCYHPWAMYISSTGERVLAFRLHAAVQHSFWFLFLHHMMEVCCRAERAARAHCEVGHMALSGALWFPSTVNCSDF